MGVLVRVGRGLTILRSSDGRKARTDTRDCWVLRQPIHRLARSDPTPPGSTSGRDHDDHRVVKNVTAWRCQCRVSRRADRTGPTPRPGFSKRGTVQHACLNNRNTYLRENTRVEQTRVSRRSEDRTGEGSKWVKGSSSPAKTVRTRTGKNFLRASLCEKGKSHDFVFARRDARSVDACAREVNNGRT